MRDINDNFNLAQYNNYKKTIHDNIQSKKLTYESVLQLDENEGDLSKKEAIKAAKKWCKDQIELTKAKNELSSIQAALSKLKVPAWTDIEKHPENFKLLKRVPFSEEASQYPKNLNDTVGDEINIVFLDVETTGLSHELDKLIELGLVKIKYSPSQKTITSIDLVQSEYQDPKSDIPEFITELTGISNSDTDGKTIDISEVESWLESEDTYIIAHNAKFDRPFFHMLMGKDNYRWGCSASQIEWSKYKDFRIESAKLEYILLKLGYFYEGHRASIDCLAMVQMFCSLPQALEDLLITIDQNSCLIEAVKAPFDMKDQLKNSGYRWNGDKKVWWIEVNENQLQSELDELDSFSNRYSSKDAHMVKLNARNRFKKAVN
jgi:DNA polymerase-3 subunit epsilon